MSPYSKYQESQTLTADPGTLVLMLYDAGIAALKRSKKMLESPSYRRDEFSTQIVKAQNVVMELIAALNFNAGEIARNLWKLYDYMAWQLRHADLNKDVRLIDDVLFHLTSLREAWVQVMQQQQTTMPTPPVSQYQQSYTRSSMVA